jgi:putative colanic acid biosynthesis acetyltransferase WcaF
MNSAVDLSLFDNSWYCPGRSRFVQALWFFVGLPLLRSSFIPFSAFRVHMLRIFGASVGRGVVIKPGVRIKYPWRLSLGDNSWIGEDCWIDNLAQVDIGSHSCISQGTYLCTGNHDWSDPAFGLMIKAIVLKEGCWVGARATICPGVTLNQCAVAAAGSVVTRDVGAFEIHSGNPAQCVRIRQIRCQEKPPLDFAEIAGGLSNSVKP